MVNPVALSFLSEVGVLALHLLNHHDGEVICRVARGVEVGCYWLYIYIFWNCGLNLRGKQNLWSELKRETKFSCGMTD